MRILKERTRQFHIDMVVGESQFNPGKALIELHGKDLYSGEADSCGIRLSVQQIEELIKALTEVSKDLTAKQDASLANILLSRNRGL